MYHCLSIPPSNISKICNCGRRKPSVYSYSLHSIPFSSFREKGTFNIIIVWSYRCSTWKNSRDLPQFTRGMIKDLQALGSPTVSQDKVRNLGVHSLDLGHFLSGPGFYFHTFPDTVGHTIKIRSSFLASASLQLCSWLLQVVSNIFYANSIFNTFFFFLLQGKFKVTWPVLGG